MEREIVGLAGKIIDDDGNRYAKIKWNGCNEYFWELSSDPIVSAALYNYYTRN